MDPTYEIMNGVRRAKAAQLAGRESIPAKLYARDTGKLLREFDVRVEHLRSPHKNSIQRVRPSDEARWQRIELGENQADWPFPPIEIVEGDKGPAIEDVTFDFGGGP